MHRLGHVLSNFDYCDMSIATRHGLYFWMLSHTPAITREFFISYTVTGMDLWACVVSTGVICIFYTSVVSRGVRRLWGNKALEGQGHCFCTVACPSNALFAKSLPTPLVVSIRKLEKFCFLMFCHQAGPHAIRCRSQHVTSGDLIRCQGSGSRRH